MADTYTLQYSGERVDQDLERAERATVDLPLAATLGAEAQGFPLVVTTALSEVDEMYKLYAANRSRYRWMLVVTQASGGAFVEVAEVEPVTQSGGIDLVFDSKYNGRRYAVTLKLAGGEVTTVSAHVLADLSNPVLQGKSAGGGDTPIREVTDRSGKTFYPVTAAAGVKMPDGTTLDAALGYKDHTAYILKDFTKSYHNNAGSNITDRSMVVETTQSGVTANFNLNSRIPVAASDFIFVRMKLRVDKECSLRIITYSDALDQRGRWFVFKAGRTYEIYYRGTAASMGGHLNVGISIPAANNIGQSVTIEDLIVTLNNYDAWCDAESRATLKNFDTDYFTVDEGGTGHFFSISQACDFARDVFDVVNNPLTLFIRNGLYDHEAPKNVAMGYPNAVINKGANRISLIGESRDGVIVSYENNAANRAKIIEAGGECTIANMTVNSLNDESYTDTSAGGHQNCYCIHIDSAFAASQRYFTTVRNCKLFSTCHSPVGAGLANNQTIRLDGCECVSDTHVGTSTGAVAIHSSTDAAAKNMAVEINDCRLMSLDGTKALYMPDVAGGVPFTQIDVTLQDNIYYTTGAEITDADFLAKHKVTPWSDASFSEISVIAHSDCTLEERVAQLESQLVGVLSGKVLIPELQVKKLGVWGGNNIVVTGAGAPSKAPDRAGQFYIDTKNNAVYHSVGNNAVSDWKNG